MSIDIISKIQTGTLPDTNATQLFLMDVEKFLDALPQQPLFDLVVTSPPYNIGKEYETQKPLTDYVAWQRRIMYGMQLQLIIRKNLIQVWISGC